MTVKAILATKGTDVLSIEPTATLETAVKMLANHRIGALLVLGPDRRVIGIFRNATLCGRSASTARKPCANRFRRS
jgi:CBS domain-containing protein